jgi:hypothetical protein
MLNSIFSIIQRLNPWFAGSTDSKNTQQREHAGDVMHGDVRALATEAALSASSDASLASLVSLWEHEHEVHDLEHPPPRGVRHT